MLMEGEIALRSWGDSRGANEEQQEEQQLVQAALAGDRAAFDSLVARHWRKIASVAGIYFRDPNEVEDVVQETLIRAFQSLTHFRQEASLQTWLIRIAINVCKSRQGGFWQRRIRLLSHQEVVEQSDADTGNVAETSLLRNEWERTVRCAVGQLPEKYRLPIILHYMENLSGAEVAKALDLSESAVWARIYTGCRMLRKRLGNWLNS